MQELIIRKNPKHRNQNTNSKKTKTQTYLSFGLCASRNLCFVPYDKDDLARIVELKIKNSLLLGYRKKAPSSILTKAQKFDIL